MDINSPSSLVFYSSVKIASTLFCHQDLLYLKRRHLVGWVKVQDKITRLVKLLNLPKGIEESVQELVQPVGDQIRRWLSRRTFVNGSNINLYNKFSWTSHGMIDYRRTAKNFIESRQTDLSLKFTLALLDAVDDYAISIIQDSYMAKKLVWSVPACKTDSKAMSEFRSMMAHLLPESSVETEFHNHYYFPLKYFVYEREIEKIASNGNTSLTRYLMKRMEPQKKAPLVKKLALNILKSNNRFVNLDTLLFLLSEMDIHQINELLIENTEHVLLRFLEWPLQVHFMKLVQKLWNTMSQVTFNSILQAIVQHIIQNCSISNNPFGYRDIFRDFWRKSPPANRRASMNELITPILSSLFRTHGYATALSNLLGDESFPQKLEVLFYSNADSVLEILSNENKAKAFETILQRHFSPDDIPLDFGEKYYTYTQDYLISYYGELLAD